VIKKVLQLIVSEGILDKNQIARQVGMQVETLDDIIRLLVERGYLRMENDGCDVESACSGCHSSAGCDTITSTGQAFYITEKGKAYASMNGGGSK
jgi:predicted transcriptional regulator